MTNNYSVYCHINKANGKKYFGITSQHPEKRWMNGNGYRNNKYFYAAIMKYGWGGFDHIIVASKLTRDEACLTEKYLIQAHGTQDKNKGYNITDGGDMFHHSRESRELMSKNRKGKGLRKFSEDHIRKMKENHSGGAEKKKVLCIETGKIYESINDAARDVKANKKLISNCCRKVPHYNTAKGCHWAFC